MQIKLLVKSAMLVVLLLMAAHCRPSKQPLLTCEVGDPACDFEHETTSGNDDTGGIKLDDSADSTPKQVAEQDKEQPTSTDESPAADEAQTYVEGAQTLAEEIKSMAGSDDEAEPITAVASGVNVKLTLNKNQMNGVIFQLTYSPFAEVVHKGFSIGDVSKEIVEHTFNSTKFEPKVPLNNKPVIPVRAEYQHDGSTYCANFTLDDAFTDYGKYKQAISSPGRCQQ